MRFAVDHHFRIGRQHESAGTPCQDYAISGHTGDGAYAIVADGCSGGGHTDVGARILAHAVAADLRSDPFRVVEGARKLLELQRDDMLATSATIHCNADGAHMHLLGDGILAHVFRNGAVHIEQIAWAGNMPFYRAYCDGALCRFIDHHAADETCLRIDIWDIEDGTPAHRVETRSVLDAIPGVIRTFDATQLRDIALLAVLTDGATQVDGMSVVEAVQALLSFRAPTGRFAARRLNRFLHDAGKRGRGALDDIAMAVVRIDDETATGKGASS